MRGRASAAAAAVLFLFLVTGVSFCEDAGVSRLVDEYNKDTDIQKSVIDKEYAGKKIMVEGTVDDVGQEKTFDVVNDAERVYYKVTTNIKNSAGGNAYRAILIYKDINKVRNINKNQRIAFSGDLIKVVDELLYLSIWLSADPLTEHEKELFR